MGHWAFKENKSLGETMSKEEIEAANTELESRLEHDILDKYSTSEDIIIGTWIDGSPIKRKVIDDVDFSDFIYQSSSKIYVYNLSDYIADFNNKAVIDCKVQLNARSYIPQQQRSTFRSYIHPASIEGEFYSGTQTGYLSIKFFSADADSVAAFDSVTVNIIIDYVDS